MEKPSRAFDEFTDTMIVSIASQKGGTGKTSTSISLSAGLAHKGSHRTPAVLLRVVCNWGQSTPTAQVPRGSKPRELRVLRADEARSALRPAVLETDAVRLAVLMRVFDAA